MGQKDLVLRTYLSDEKRFADLFNTYLGEREIFPEFLRELESVRIRKDEETQKVKRVEHDLLKIYEKKDKYYILGIQNQEKIDYQMIIRCMAYELEEYERQIRELQKEHQMRGDLIAEEYLSGIKKEDKIIPVAALWFILERKHGMEPENYMNFLEIKKTFNWADGYKCKIKFVGCTEI